MTRWLDPQPIDIPASFADLNLPPLIAQTLIRRGITSPDLAGAFLHPDTLPYISFPDIEKANDIVIMAIRSKEPILVWGYFDLDRQTSSYLLMQIMQILGSNDS